MHEKLNKWKVIGVLLIVLSGTAARAFADVSIDSSNYSNWEQNSYRPIRVGYTTGTSRQILGFDAHLQYNNNADNFGVPSMSNEISMSYLESVDKVLTEDITPPCHIKYTRSTSQGNYWNTGTGYSAIYDLNFMVKPTATLGGTTFDWYTAGINLLNTPAPGVSVTGTTLSRAVTITQSAAPVWNPRIGINSKNNPVVSPDTGNMLQVTWDKTQVTDDTPYDITPTAYDQHNLKFMVYRSRSDNPSNFTLLTTTSQGTTSYNDGTANGILDGNEPYDCVTPNYYTYTYKLHALDNSITPLEDANSQTVTVKSHDYTAPSAPTSSAQGTAQMYWTNDGTNFVGGTSFVGYTPGDKQVTVTWNAPAASDLAGYAVVGSDLTPWGSAALGSASGDLNGPNYVAGNSVGTNGIVLAMQAGTQITRTKQNNGSTDLQNGIAYYYNISAYDRCSYEAHPEEQGHNFSSTLTIIATPGVAPSNVTGATASKTLTGLTVSWNNPSDGSAAYFGGVRIVVKKHSYSGNPGDAFAFHEISGGTPTTYTFDTGVCPAPMDDTNNDYHVTVYTYNTAADITKRRYSSGAQVVYDTTPPDPVKYFNALPSGSDSLYLNWTSPTQDCLGVVILRKATTSEFTFDPMAFPVNGTLYTTASPHVAGSGLLEEVIVYSGPLENFQDTGLSSLETYYYRIWAYDSAYNYPSIYDFTAATPGGTGGGITFAGPTTIRPGWNLIATGQQKNLALDKSSLGTQGASTGDQVFIMIPGSTNFRQATMNSSNQWIDEEFPGVVATWELSPDAGFYILRSTNTPFTWEAR